MSTTLESLGTLKNSATHHYLPAGMIHQSTAMFFYLLMSFTQMILKNAYLSEMHKKCTQEG
ncbi:MAG: hypothetical protein HXS47_03185 [Theionarchaea archaeon]|nr:hypothetical protein [Theionarchaea archaeon]